MAFNLNDFFTFFLSSALKCLNIDFPKLTQYIPKVTSCSSGYNCYKT